jgi:hypothetical protein
LRGLAGSAYPLPYRTILDDRRALHSRAGRAFDTRRHDTPDLVGLSIAERIAFSHPLFLGEPHTIAAANGQQGHSPFEFRLKKVDFPSLNRIFSDCLRDLAEFSSVYVPPPGSAARARVQILGLQYGNDYTWRRRGMSWPKPSRSSEGQELDHWMSDRP